VSTSTLIDFYRSVVNAFHNTFCFMRDLKGLAGVYGESKQVHFRCLTLSSLVRLKEERTQSWQILPSSFYHFVLLS
jgi:hypothetical protein